MYVIYIYIHLFIYLYVYIYIEREREIASIVAVWRAGIHTNCIYIYSFTGLSIFHDVVIDAAFDY